MKYRFALIALAILTITTFVVFETNEGLILRKLAPYFPASEENSPGYYADLVSFLFSESIWLAILIVITIYFTLYGSLLKTVNALEASLLRNKATAMPLIYVLFFIVTVLVATLGLEQFPNSADEFAYLFQAEQLSDGTLWSPVHPVPDFFEFHHLAQKDGKWVGRFPPGWPLLLSLAFLFHIPPFLINALLGLASAIILHRLVRRIYDERIALWSSIALMTSSFFIFNSATFFSHIASLLEGLLFVYFSYRFLQTEQKLFAILAGVFMGMLIMTRQLTALMFLLPFVVFFFYKLKLRAILPLILVGLGALPFVAFFLWYNYAITGDPLVPVTMWTNADEALGFVKGHTPAKGAKFTFKRLSMFLYWASPSLLILYFIFLAMRLREFKKILLHPEDYIFVLLIVAYFFYYHSGGNQYGPRFYLEGFPFLIVFVVAKVLRTNYPLAKVFLFCGLLYNVAKIPFATYREHKVIEERKDIYHQVAENGIGNAVVIISSGTGIMRPMPVEDLNRNDLYYKNDVVYARDLGDQNRSLIEFYKGKDFYLYKRGFDDVKGTLVKIDP